MISTTFKISRFGNRELSKQESFARVSALTKTAHDVKTSQIKATEEKFTIRNNWNTRGPLAFKVKGATKQNPVALIETAAEFLEKFIRERPGSFTIKLPQGNFIAIPTSNVKRTKRDIIRAAQRPAALRGKRDVVLPMKSGRGYVLFQGKPNRSRGERRSSGGRGRAGRLVALYILTPRARIKQVDVIQGPAEKTVQKRFAINYAAALEKALATAR